MVPSNTLERTQFSQLKITRILCDGDTQHLDGFSLILSPYVFLLFLQLGVLYKECRWLYLLLCDLFCFNDSRILPTETQLRQINVIQNDVEVSSTLYQFTMHPL